MLIVGITGGIGSGKSTVASLFASFGIEIIDADLLAREVVEPGTVALEKIVDYFGSEILSCAGTLERARLRQIVFHSPAKKAWLESLLHPLIADLVKSRIAACSSDYCIVVSPLLLETGQRELVDRVLVVDVAERSQLLRTLPRDQSDESTIRAIIAAQSDRQVRLQAADDIIDNEGDIDTLKTEVETLHTRFLALAGC